MYVVIGVYAVIYLAVFLILPIVFAKRGEAYLEEYEGVFGKRTCSSITIGIIAVPSVPPVICTCVQSGAGMSDIPLVLGVYILLMIVMPVIHVIVAYKKCPEELKGEFFKAMFIASFAYMRRFFRPAWNILWRVTSVIPGLGWTANFVIEDDPVKKAQLVREGEAADEATRQRWAEEKAREEERIERDKRELEEEHEWIRKKAWNEHGRTDIEFSRDGQRWKYSNETWQQSRSVK